MIRSYNPVADEEMEKTLQEFREGRLVVGTASKVPVTSLRLALAIGRSRAQRKGVAASPLGQWNIETQ